MSEKHTHTTHKLCQKNIHTHNTQTMILCQYNINMENIQKEEETCLIETNTYI